VFGKLADQPLKIDLPPVPYKAYFAMNGAPTSHMTVLIWQLATADDSTFA